MGAPVIDKQAAVAIWYKQLCATNNDAFLPLFACTSRFLVLRGGGGSGKSIFAGRKVLERVTSEPGHRWLVCRKVARTLRQSCFAQLVGQANDYYADSRPVCNRGDMSISFANGSVILFAGLDDVEKLKSIYDITGIWIEEASEITEADFNQLDIRLRTDCPYYLQMILSFNPISINHWLKKRFFDRQDPRATVHNSTYKDNRFIIPEAVATLEAFRETDEYYYMVYCCNQWGVTGKTVFNARALSERLMQLKPPRRIGYFAYAYDGRRLTDIQWTEDDKGYIKLYKEPAAGKPYVIGGDTAGGTEAVADDSDYFVGQVLDNTTGEQVAVLREHKIDEDEYARQMYCLGTYYNTAMIGIEANFSTYPNKELARLNYPRLYVRETEDDYTGAIKRAFGFKTTSVTRPVIIAGLIQAARDDVTLINDSTTIEEMLTFVRNPEKGFRAEAEPGSHDDTVMALAIAHYIRPSHTMSAASPAVSETVWTADMWEDYQAADREQRAYLESKWGKPKRR